MSSVKKRPKVDIFQRSLSMNRSLRVKDKKRRLHDQLHVGIQDKLEKEIKLRDGASRMLAACTHEDQLLEVAKSLHTSNARMYTYMAELQKLKTAEIMERVMNEEGTQIESKVCAGRIAISDIRIPLMWNDPERYSGVKNKEASRYAVFCLVHVGSEVQDTELVCTDKTTTDVCFRDILVFEDAMYNFKMQVVIYAFPMSEESITAPTPQKLLSRLNRSIGKSEGKRIRNRLKESPAANMKMGPQYEKLGSLTLDLTCVEDHIKSHDIQQLASYNSGSARCKPLLPLYGSLTCRLVAQPKCITEKCLSGFVHYMEMVVGVPCWSYMWCEVKAGKLRCWLNPEDTEKHPRSCIDLIAPDVRINEIEKSRQKRPNSFQVRDLEQRHIFSAGDKEDLSKWIKGLRQHRSDYTAWSIACVSPTNGDQPTPMFIASPSPYKLPSALLFDSSVRKTLIYEQMSIDSPTKSDSEGIGVSDMLGKREEPCQIGVAMIEANQPAPWAGLFSGALNRSVTKVTKLKDVQNIDSSGYNSTNTTPRSRTKSCDALKCNPKTSSSQRDSNKPPLPRRPSEDLIKEKMKHNAMSPMSPRAIPKIESMKSGHTSESCSETGLSDFCQSSDDVFLSSDENLLNSLPSRKKPPHSSNSKVRLPSRGRKKRRAPMPPSSGQDERQVNSHTNLTPGRAGSKASLSSASSLDDILDSGSGRRTPYPGPKPSPRNLRRSDGDILDMDPEGRKSQISLVSNSTQVSNTSSGYKSDSEGLNPLISSPLTHRKKKIVSNQNEDLSCEITVTERDVKPKAHNRLGVKVLPIQDNSGVNLETVGILRSHSLDADSLLRSSGSRSKGTSQIPLEESDDSSRSRFSSLPSSRKMEDASKRTSHHPSQIGDSKSQNGPSKSDKLLMKMLSTKKDTPSRSKPPFLKPIPAPRRSYLTAVESSKVKTPKNPIYDVPRHFEEPHTNGSQLPNTPTPQNGVNICEDIYAEPIPKALRSKNIAGEEPIYAQVCKVRKNSGPKPSNNPEGVVLGPKKGVDAYMKAHKSIINVCKQRMDEEEKSRKESSKSDDYDDYSKIDMYI